VNENDVTTHEDAATAGPDAGRGSPPAPLDEAPDPARRQDLPPPDGIPRGQRSPRRRRHWVVAGIAIGAVVAIAVTGVVVLVTRDGGPNHPSAWDPSVAELVSFVEDEKGASFEHPVSVVVLDEAAFKERLSIDDELTDDEREDIDHTEAALRALGLHGGTGSLVDQLDTFMTEGVAAYYDPDEDEIVAPETSPGDIAARSTLVHELTHALQDQLGQLEDADNSDAQAALKALIEGEAEHVQAAWIEALTDNEREGLDEDRAERVDDASSALDDVGPALIAVFMLPYTVGESMVSMLDETHRLDDAFDDPPRSTADLLDPVRWLDPVETEQVEAPSLADGEEQQGEDDMLGAHLLYLTLASVLGPADALNVVSGWGGDSLRFYRATDGTRCLRASIVGVDSAATGRIRDALDTWVESRPDGAASTSEGDGHVLFDACDRGTSEETLTTELANVPAMRADLVSAFTDTGVSIERATCVVTEVLDRLPLDLVMADEVSVADEERMQEVFAAAATSCEG
jgi:hypothetical protein